MSSPRPRRLLAAGGILAIPLALSLAVRITPLAGKADTLPPPEQDIRNSPGELKTAVFAGGCFWGMEAVFESIRGVSDVVTGYAGGARETARYGRVSSGSTGHAEGIRITYDPDQVSYGQLLRVFFSVAHDPTQLNRQGPDVGPQYRSAIFTIDPAELRVAEMYIQQLDRQGAFPTAIVTKVEASDAFYEAESHHQNFVARNPVHPYVVLHDLPKIAKLRSQLPELTR